MRLTWSRAEGVVLSHEAKLKELMPNAQCHKDPLIKLTFKTCLKITLNCVVLQECSCNNCTNGTDHHASKNSDSFIHCNNTLALVSPTTKWLTTMKPQKHFMEYRSLALTLARPADISLAHVYLGDISTIKSNYSNAAYHYLEAIHNYGTNNSSTLFKLEMPSVSALYAKQGAALKQTSQMLQAVEAFRNAIHHAPRPQEQASGPQQLGELLQSMGDYTGALQEYKEAVNLGEELNDLVSLGWAHGNLGNAHLGLHQKDAALHHLKKALALTIEHESTPQAISRAYNNLGTSLPELGGLQGGRGELQLGTGSGHIWQVLSIANHNRGCAYLEWAEQLRSEKKGATSGISRNLQVLCNPGTMVPSPGYSPTKLYRLGASDLTHAIELCNENNSRTFHKLQDCLIGLQQMDEALVVAEQCRARTLGERLLEKMGGGINHLTPPLSLEQIQYIVKSQEHPVVYLSYTGAKLIVWLIIPIYGRVLIDCRVVEVERLEKEKFGGKTFDQYVRQSVQEAVVGNDLELFQDVSGSQISPLTVLFDVVVFPVLDMLGKCKLQHLKNLILIPDSYTSLIPFVALHPEGDFNSTFGSTFSIQMMPSLLVMGPDSSNGKPSKSADILLLPSEVEQMNIKAALVVLSSCDSGRGMSILTTLWRIPDESAGMFMQFFYQYLVDGLGTHPCSSEGHSECEVLQEIAVVEKLEQGLIQTTSQPSNVQGVLQDGGGVFWISCRSEEVAAACVKKALEVIDEIELKDTQYSCIGCSGEHRRQSVLSPSDEDRVALEILVDITKGSPPVIDIMTSKGMCTKYPESLDAFTPRLIFTLDESEPFSNVIDKQPMKARNCVSFDLWDAINTLADLCELTSYEELFLHCLCIFHNVPVQNVSLRDYPA
eukprot:Em0019g221a